MQARRDILRLGHTQIFLDSAFAFSFPDARNKVSGTERTAHFHSPGRHLIELLISHVDKIYARITKTRARTHADEIPVSWYCAGRDAEHAMLMLYFPIFDG